MPSLTILICTHDRVGLLERTLASLNAAARPDGWAVDVLVAANACSDGTHAFLDQYSRRTEGSGEIALAWFAEPAPGKSNALNSAMPRVQSDLVAFVDDDHRVDGGYLRAMCDVADAYPRADLFCGRILPDWDGTEPIWVHDQGPYRIYPLPVPRFDLGDAAREVTPDVAIPGGGNLFLRTRWLRKVGRFDTGIGPMGHDLGGAEDLDWVLRALRLGARLQYAPFVIQYHYVDTARLTLTYLMKKAYKRTASTVAIEPGARGGTVPRYLYRKVAEYALKAATAIGHPRRRFYLVRTAAALGEITGHRAGSRRARLAAAAQKAD
jgi:GT2 family glycosyltransferase